jgi:uncharacterized protein
MIMKIAHDIVAAITGFLKKDSNVVFGLLFGSHAREKANKRSDVDVAVYFKDPPRGMEILDYSTRLSNHIRKDVDLVILNTASPLLRHQVMKHGIRLIIRDRTKFTKFREDTIRLYQDYKYLNYLEMYDR